MTKEVMEQVVVYFEHMVRTLKLRDESEPSQLLFKLRQAIAKAEKQEQDEPVAWVSLTDDEIYEFDIDPVEAKRMIAKLKQKNNIGVND
jgi:transcription initiation factor IIF auxiliary subunit